MSSVVTAPVNLPVHKAVFLCAIHDDSGRLSLRTRGLVAAIIAELILQGRFVVEEKDRALGYYARDRLRVVNHENIDDQVLNYYLFKIGSKKKVKRLVSWIRRLQWAINAKDDVGDLLVADHVLQKQKGKFYSLCPHYRVLNIELKQSIVKQARRAIQNDYEQVDSRMSSIIAVLYETGRLRQMFGVRETLRRRSRIRHICEHDTTSRAIALALRQIERDEQAADHGGTD